MNEEKMPVIIAVPKKMAMAAVYAAEAVRRFLVGIAIAAMTVNFSCETSVRMLKHVGKIMVPSLIRELEDPKHFHIFKHYLAAALGEIGDRRAIPALEAALERDSWLGLGKSYSAEALGKFGDAASAPALIKALHDREAYVAARDALPMLKPSGDVENALFDAMEKDLPHRFVYMQVLSKIQDDAGKRGKPESTAGDGGSLDLKSAIRQMRRRPVAANVPKFRKLPQAKGVAVI